MRADKVFAVVLSLLIWFAAHKVVAISLSQSIDKTEMRFEDSAKFEITVEWPGPQFAYRFSNPLNPYIDRLKTGPFTSSISSIGTGKDEITTKKFTYVLIPTSSGEAKIDPIKINYFTWPDSLLGELITEPVLITVSEPKPKPDPSKFPIWITIFGGLLVVGSGAAFYVLRAKAVRARPTVITPSGTALNELTKLKSASGTDLKKFQTGIYTILTHFLNTKFKINVSGQSEEKIIELLSKTGITEKAQISIKDWLIQAERDKFRPVEAAPGETVRLEMELRRFFESVN